MHSNITPNTNINSIFIRLATFCLFQCFNISHRLSTHFVTTHFWTLNLCSPHGEDVPTGRCPPWELVEAVTGLCKLCLINMHTEDSIVYYVEETSNIPYSKRAPSNHDIIQKQQTWYFSKTAPQPPWHFSKIHLATMASFNCTLATM